MIELNPKDWLDLGVALSAVLLALAAFIISISKASKTLVDELQEELAKTKDELVKTKAELLETKTKLDLYITEKNELSRRITDLEAERIGLIKRIEFLERREKELILENEKMEQEIDKLRSNKELPAT